MKMTMIFFMFVSFFLAASGANLNGSVEIMWGEGQGRIINGELLTLSLDNSSGSGFQSRDKYLFGEISMQLKLVPGNSAGTVTAFYLSSLGDDHDEIDFEYLGNLSGDPYILHTNVFVASKGNREQQFYLWFDPTADFHTYTVLWNSHNVIFSVDDTPIRVFKNAESQGVPYPKYQAMRAYSSLWSADDWATRGGLVKTDWSKAPFVASYRNFNAHACVWSSNTNSCASNSNSTSNSSWMVKEIDEAGLQQIASAQKQYMVYDYCKDANRFPQGLPAECTPAETKIMFGQIWCYFAYCGHSLSNKMSI